MQHNLEKSRVVGILYLIAIAAFSFAGCSSNSVGTANSTPPPAKVTVAEVVCKPLKEWDEFTGRLEAINSVEIRPRVSGALDHVYFKEGAIVKKGDLLFLIDPRPFQADVDRLKAEVERAKSQLARANSDFQRAERLHNNNGMSVEEYDRRDSLRGEAKAQLASTEASLRGSELSLEFTRITSPITGRVGRAEITEGNLVSSGPAQPTLLTTVVSLDPIYAYFDGDEQIYLKYSRMARTGERPSSRDVANPIYLGLADETGYPHSGKMDFVDNRINSTTGTIRGRAIFDNKDLSLTPGLFARLKLIGSGDYRACQVQDSAVGTDLNQKFVFAVGSDNKVQYRPIKPGPIVDGLRVIREGVKEGDVVIINGLQRVRPGVIVVAEKVSMAPGTPSSSSAHPTLATTKTSK